VQIDESCVGGRRKYQKGRNPGKNIWVLGIIDEISKKVVLYYVENRKQETLIPIIKQHVPIDTIVKTDQFKTYDKLDEDYLHLNVNHKQHFVDPTTTVNTQMIESLWSRVKKFFKVRNGTNRKSIQGLLNLISFFINYKNPMEKFLEIIKIK